MDNNVEEKVETTLNEQPAEEKKEEKKKNKGLIIGLIIAGSLVFLGLIALLVILSLRKPINPKPVVKPDNETKITITFDSDGGLEVEKLTFKKGTKVQLKQSTKEGFSFVGWFDREKQYTDDDTPTIEKDLTLKAKWEELKEDEKLMKIVFDSKGGSKVSSITVKCVGDSATITGLPTPKKDSYNFMSWADKNGTPILNGALLTCTDTLYLYANWEYDGPTANPNQDPTPSTPTKEKTYKCPDGYELKDTNKCVKLAVANVEKYCDSGWTLTRDQSYCAKSSSNISGTRTCPYKSWNGYSGTGTYYEAGRGYCGYFELTSYIGRRQDCINAGGTFASNNHCYRYTDINYEVTCASDEMRFEAQAVVPGSNPGCYKATTPKTKKTCPDGYSNVSTYGDCAIVTDAKLE